MKQHELIRSIYGSHLKSRAIIVMSCLIFYMNVKTNACFPSIKTIAKSCSISVNTVKRALNDLVIAGFVVKEARFIEAKNGAQSSNLYHLSIGKECAEIEAISENSIQMVSFEELSELSQDECSREIDVQDIVPESDRDACSGSLCREKESMFEVFPDEFYPELDSVISSVDRDDRNESNIDIYLEKNGNLDVRDSLEEVNNSKAIHEICVKIDKNRDILDVNLDVKENRDCENMPFKDNLTEEDKNKYLTYIYQKHSKEISSKGNYLKLEIVIQNIGCNFSKKVAEIFEIITSQKCCNYEKVIDVPP